MIWRNKILLVGFNENGRSDPSRTMRQVSFVESVLDWAYGLVVLVFSRVAGFIAKFLANRS
jgi:hypothetical protein